VKLLNTRSSNRNWINIGTKKNQPQQASWHPQKIDNKNISTLNILDEGIMNHL
jgi:hypothetical protein